MSDPRARAGDHGERRPRLRCAAVALDLWNELEISEANGGAPDFGHLGVRAFARVTPAEDWAFASPTRIPRQRGLGSSAAVIALGLVAGRARGRTRARPRGAARGRARARGPRGQPRGGARRRRLLDLGGPRSRGSPTTSRRCRSPSSPRRRVATATARTACPSSVPHADAAFTVGRAALLGAALASGSAELLAAALADRLHEPYRVARAPLLTRRPRAASRRRARRDPLRVRPDRRSSGRDREAAAACEAELASVPARRHPRLGVSRPTGGRAALMSENPYDRPSDPGKRHSAALTDGPDRAPARGDAEGRSASPTTTSRGR